jgi:hypothetical protein
MESQKAVFTIFNRTDMMIDDIRRESTIDKLPRTMVPACHKIIYRTELQSR